MAEAVSAEAVSEKVEVREVKIAVALLTCDRYDYTVKTVDSFLEHNDPSKFLLFHADDASTDPRVVEYVQSRGFATVVRNDKRQGCSATTTALIRAVTDRVQHDTLTVYLQNDFESVRPLPVTLIAELLSRGDVSFVQLAYRRPRSPYMKRLRYVWPDGAPWTFGDSQRGEYVWTHVGGGTGYHPTVATLAMWLQCVGVKRELHFLRATKRLSRRVARLTRPVMRHIGRRVTPNGLFGFRRKNRRSKVGSGSYQPGRTAMHAGVSLCHYLAQTIKPGMRTLELGSGMTTWLFYTVGCDHTALENAPEYAPPLPCVQICPLVGGWYKWKPAKPYDMIFVDGPRKRRSGILRVIDRLVHDRTIIVMDDTNRRRDSALADQLAKRLAMTRLDYPAKWKRDFRKQFSVLSYSRQ